MGLSANYQEINTNDLDRIVETIESEVEINLYRELDALANNEELNQYNMDKMWDSLNFLITGETSENLTFKSLVTDAIFGSCQFPANNEELNQYNMDKMWDSLNFLITGETSENLTFKSLVTDAIFGSCQFPDDMIDIYLAFVAPDGVCDVADALNDIDIDEYLENFDMKEFAKNNVYPDIWDYEDEEEFIPDGVCDVADALNDIDIDEYLENFDMKEFAKNNVYPDIWDYEDEEEFIKADLKAAFEIS